MQPLTVLAHGGHPAYDHPAMAVLMALALIVPWMVLIFVARWFLRQRDQDKRDQG